MLVSSSNYYIALLKSMIIIYTPTSYQTSL